MLSSTLPELGIRDQRLFRQQCYVDGKWVEAEDGACLKVYNPADASILGTVPKFGAADTRRAIESAESAFPAWRSKSAKERSKILRRWYELCIEYQDDLGAILTAEQGK